MGKERGWVTVSVHTYQSQRSSASSSQRVFHQEYTVDESGATLNAVSRNGEVEPQEQRSDAPSTSIFIRDLKLSGRRAYIRYERQDGAFSFIPVLDERRTHSAPDFPCHRGDVFLKLGMRGQRLIPWRLREGDVFRLGQAYVLVRHVRVSPAADSGLVEYLSNSSPAASEREVTSPSEEEPDSPPDSAAAQCYICYETGDADNPMISPCQCAGSVKYVHVSCLSRWIQPEGTSTVNTNCPVCKSRYSEKTQALMIRPPAMLLESWSNHRAHRHRHWVSFAQHGTANLGRFVGQNDVVIQDHSVSGEHAFIAHTNGEFWLRDKESSNGSFIRLRAPLRLGFGETLQLKMGKSLLYLQAKRSRWSRIRNRLNMLALRSSDDQYDELSRTTTERPPSESSSPVGSSRSTALGRDAL
ncbi:hypothetical protein AB1Y20_016502 [Prymnesium parvum]|uniref:RING-type E3 ubiquitin transferase n=1 Tax=Prymnesium parvum TaxID=97485 RepID=A0AB34IDP0_PRYPA|mmetsp:Transcript_4817/g.9966  ORF Transcript_4817/g.9966 Transcript_4817/m.9966 type:complete len:413 (+) Transcript_4817:3-1241(+)